MFGYLGGALFTLTVGAAGEHASATNRCSQCCSCSTSSPRWCSGPSSAYANPPRRRNPRFEGPQVSAPTPNDNWDGNFGFGGSFGMLSCVTRETGLHRPRSGLGPSVRFQLLSLLVLKEPRLHRRGQAKPSRPPHGFWALEGQLSAHPIDPDNSLIPLSLWRDRERNCAADDASRTSAPLSRIILSKLDETPLRISSAPLDFTIFLKTRSRPRKRVSIAETSVKSITTRLSLERVVLSAPIISLMFVLVALPRNSTCGSHFAIRSVWRVVPATNSSSLVHIIIGVEFWSEASPIKAIRRANNVAKDTALL